MPYIIRWEIFWSLIWTLLELDYYPLGQMRLQSPPKKSNFLEVRHKQACSLTDARRAERPSFQPLRPGPMRLKSFPAENKFSAIAAKNLGNTTCIPKLVRRGKRSEILNCW